MRPHALLAIALAVGLTTSLTLTPQPGRAQPAAQPDFQLQTIQSAFAQRFGNLAVTAVRRTPFAGLFEVQLGANLVYTDAQASYVLDGVLIDAASRRNLTEARLQALAKEVQANLPLELAVKQVKGEEIKGEETKGEAKEGRWIAIFEDPNCGYCKQLRRSLEAIDNLTIYSFLYPILSPDSREKARDIWCAGNPVQALDDWMLRGKTPARSECDAPLETILALGQQLMVRGTPAIFFDNGDRADGALPLAALQAKLGGS